MAGDVENYDQKIDEIISEMKSGVSYNVQFPDHAQFELIRNNLRELKKDFNTFLKGPVGKNIDPKGPLRKDFNNLIKSTEKALIDSANQYKRVMKINKISDEIGAGIIKPVKNDLKSGRRLSKIFGIIGVLGVIVTVAGTIYSSIFSNSWEDRLLNTVDTLDRYVKPAIDFYMGSEQGGLIESKADNKLILNEKDIKKVLGMDEKSNELKEAVENIECLVDELYESMLQKDEHKFQICIIKKREYAKKYYDLILGNLDLQSTFLFCDMLINYKSNNWNLIIDIYRNIKDGIEKTKYALPILILRAEVFYIIGDQEMAEMYYQNIDLKNTYILPKKIVVPVWEKEKSGSIEYVRANPYNYVKKKKKYIMEQGENPMLKNWTKKDEQ